jgi:hypothetical protein
MTFSTLESTKDSLSTLLQVSEIPCAARELVEQTTFTKCFVPILPCPFRQLEAAVALKAVEVAVANAIGKERFEYLQEVTIDLQHGIQFLLMAYIATVDGLGKLDKGVKSKLKGK